MKHSYFYIINGVLAVGLIVLYILFFTSQPSSDQKMQIRFNPGDSTFILPVAYVNIDSLLTNYNFAKDLNEALMRKEESSRATLNQKETQLNAAAQEFQRKLQNNAFLSQERAEQEQQRILKMQQEYQQTAQNPNLPVQSQSKNHYSVHAPDNGIHPREKHAYEMAHTEQFHHYAESIND